MLQTRSTLLGSKLFRNRESALRAARLGIPREVSEEELLPTRLRRFLELSAIAYPEVSGDAHELVCCHLRDTPCPMAQVRSRDSVSGRGEGYQADKLRRMPVQESTRVVKGSASPEVAEHYGIRVG